MNHTELDNEFGFSSAVEDSDIYKEIGCFLRAARQQMGIGIEKVSLELKVKPQYLAMIEEGNYEEVSKIVYYYGCVYSIMRFLKIKNSQAIIEMLFTKNINFQFQVNQANSQQQSASKSAPTNIIKHLISVNKTNFKKRIVVVIIVLSVFFVLNKLNQTSKNQASEQAIEEEIREL